MTDIWFIPLIGILGIISTLISSKGSLYDKRYRWYKKLTKGGIAVSIIGLATIGLSIWQYRNAKNEDEIKEKSEILQRRLSDSTIAAEIKKGVDSNRKELFKDLSEALAKQKLSLDTVSKNIKSLRDSPRSVVLDTLKDDPIIIVQNIVPTQTSDTLNFNVTWEVEQAQANIVFIDDLIELRNSDKTIGVLNLNRLFTDMKVPKDKPFQCNMWVINNKKVDTASFVFVGKYTPANSKKEIRIKEVYQYIFSTKMVTFIDGDKKRNFLKRYKL